MPAFVSYKFQKHFFWVLCRKEGKKLNKKAIVPYLCHKWVDHEIGIEIVITWI
jgi:hypothetical protein